MKILIFNWKDMKHPYYGGAEVNIHEQAKIWIKQGHKVTQFSPRFKDSKKEENVEGVNIIRYGGRFTNYIYAPLIYLFKLRKEYDVIIDVENGIPYFTPLYSRKPKICIIHHVHQDVFFRELPPIIAWIPLLMEKYGLRLFYRNTKIIAVSKTTEEEAITKLGIKPENITLVYNGLDHKKFYSNEKKSKKPTILYFGRLMRYKRIDKLIDIFSEVTKIIPEAELVIAGTGVVENELKEKVNKLGLKNIKFYGYVPDNKKPDIMKMAWVFVNPSSMEGWGVTIIEANSLGTPAMAFNVQGLKESIENGKTGYLVDTDKDMLEKIIYILKNNKVREKLGINSIKWSKNFTWENAAKQTLDLIKKK